ASNVGSLAAFQVDSNGQQTLPSFGFATAPEGPDAEVALVSVIPEPATLGLFLLPAALLGRRRR
ncbi:MAG: PEP-CTERM sorting domain-containing protein, partial [Phycisphaerae bacterium]